ncbi:type I-B CRISPR-associated protein Cas7/Cst2/DevR [Acetivibrio mesophilus]|uniref:Type I-B CRISPR-associated protein Cas7/Cst2/DevR n=1 Tax=Acetivibrio mesophilus TaxID=2487273 RepID=A0A4Q0I3M2_9FIRM|nr:type I-B CRISPR-associated protein Cas7/Cst2/DevR [Acetivibrio mesophilus]ODM27288.1 type I-B CRISPR-associated protein Cas7/Cst2/DevR [Clostridium sp. Bc-iso-3]RXE58874.1 type I-B CRISPR-associated protein Cas7/Cst2/DevR [Acetivibrio mesophilus]HHV29530.1 type I-B CRISPR-associated protein Cas7/Cst2/DevR [Clostridium sp.]
MNKNKVSGITLTILTESPIALSNDQGAGNYSPIKKYFYKDGIHSMTSVGTVTYELRKKLIKEYGWTASSIVKKDKNLYPRKENIEATDLNGIENDVFGFLVPDKQINKTSPLRVIPFISVNTFKSDTQTVTNRGFLNPDLGREYFDDKGNAIGIDKIPTTQALAFEEVFGDYYYYTITIELDRIGVIEVENDKYLEPGNRKYMTKELRKKAIVDLIDAILNFTRDIKHQKIHLKPLAAFGGAFRSPIPYFWNDVCVDSKGNLVMDYVYETIKGYGLNSENYVIAVSSRLPVTYKNSDFENSIVIENIPQEAMIKLVNKLEIGDDNNWYLNTEE